MTASPAVASIPTATFHLVVLPDRLQFMLNPEAEGDAETVRAKAGGIVRALPHTPYLAAGMNFDWVFESGSIPIKDVSRRLFYVKGHWLSEEFNTDDARYGTYVSRDTLGCRLKFDVKPVTERAMKDGSVQDTKESLVFSCKYNIDLVEPDGSDVILGFLDKWNDVKADATRLMSLVEGRADY